MIDIHNHVIYAFDDGPANLDEALEMLRMAKGQGISAVFATSHFNEIIPPEMEADYFEKLERLREEVLQRDIGVSIYSGCEMFYHHYMEQTISGSRIGTLGEQGTYILMEFPMYLLPDGIEETLFNLALSGFIPIIAHPERYSAVIDKPEKCLSFIKHGGLLQVNVGSILGRFGKSVQRTGMWMLENSLAHFISSDAHGSRNRTFELAEAALRMEAHLDASYIHELVDLNARKIIENERLDRVEVDEEDVGAGILGRLRRRWRLK